MEQEYHEMVLETVHESGAEEWYCPTCGRRFLMQWPPAYSKVILSEGDEYAIHSGGKGGIKMGSLEVETNGEEIPEDEPALEPWLEWFNKVDFEKLWQKDIN
jgi:hypothetical protein